VLHREDGVTWSKFDDLYDEHEKVEDAWEQERATIGLHAMATTYCSRQGSDGVIAPRWIRRKLPNERERARVLRALVEVGLFDVLPAGETVVLLDRDGEEVVVGPYAEDRHMVHDYLHHNDSAGKLKRNREWDRRRKELERDRPLVAAIKARDQDRCRYCTRLVDWRDRRGTKGGTYDHVIPRGENTLDNVVVACRGCNQKKGARTPEEAGMPLSPPGQVGPDHGQTEGKSRPGRSQLRPALPDPTRPDPTIPPQPPEGGRARDRDRFAREMTTWAEQAYPDLPAGVVAGAVQRLRAARSDITPDRVRQMAHRIDPRLARRAA
jgi:5-methylcytosine-specific restriction endonuclease McrA